MAASASAAIHLPAFATHASLVAADVPSTEAGARSDEVTLAGAMSTMSFREASGSQTDTCDRRLVADDEWYDVPLDPVARRNKVERFAAHLIDAGERFC
jgi:hypothetical protein